jgi:D-alanyl-lipoteichoic acid acyltransferase DltB (MBOAT superfamily)
MASMLFNTTVFLQFFAGFILLYHLCRHSLRWRNLLIVGASYLFYGWWDYRFLGLLVGSSVFDFLAGRWLDRAEGQVRRRIILGLSLAANLALLGFFKYYDFFATSLAAGLAAFQITVPVHNLNLILPVGISFYTFQSMSYVIDVYRRQIKASTSLLQYLAFVSFFPQLVAGPIQRCGELLPQLETARVLTRAMWAEGLWLMTWGMFKKVVLADNLAPLVEMVYGNPHVTGPAVVLGTIAFAFQIYCDFSGYSDLARGLGRILGFDIVFNFNLPYWATDLRDFWRRWHISLSTWLRDYLYVSLGGNRRGSRRTSLNLMITMVLGGLWHGAAWNFVLWGAWHGAGLMATRWIHNPTSPPSPAIRLALRMATLLFVLYGWLLFRAESAGDILRLTSALTDWAAPSWTVSYVLSLCLWTCPLLCIEAWQKKTNNLLAPLTAPLGLRLVLNGLLLFSILVFWEKNPAPFIYFQF